MIYNLLLTFGVIFLVFATVTSPLFFATKKWAAFRTRKTSTSPLYDYSSYQVRSTLSLLYGVVLGILFFVSAMFFFLYESHPCELQDIYKLFPLATEYLRAYGFLFAPLFWILPIFLAGKMFYLHHRQETLENNKPNEGFRLIGMGACWCTTAYFLILIQNKMQSGGGCHGL